MTSDDEPTPVHFPVRDYTVPSDDEPCPVHAAAPVIPTTPPVAAPVLPPTPAPTALPVTAAAPVERTPQTTAHRFPVASNGKLLDVAIVPTQDEVTPPITTPVRPAPIASNGQLIVETPRLLPQSNRRPEKQTSVVNITEQGV